MSKSLDSVHKQIEREKIKKAVAKDVENKIIPHVQSACLAATALVLHDKSLVRNGLTSIYGRSLKYLRVYTLNIRTLRT